MIINAKGQPCPKPVILADEALSKINEGIIEILVDNEVSVKNLARFAATNGFYSEIAKEENYWKVKIVKGFPCEIPEKENKEEPEKNIFIIIASDTMGKDEKLGNILMQAYFETMKVTKEIPHTIFFLNSGVNLTTIKKEYVEIIKALEAMGVEIYSCGTCLKYFGLESELKVGYRGSTNHIVEGIKDFQKTVWIG
jgi:selenium metabolism protein YedF